MTHQLVSHGASGQHVQVVRFFFGQVMTDPLLGPPNIPLNYDDAWLVKWCYLYILYLDIDLMNTWMNDSCGGVT